MVIIFACELVAASCGNCYKATSVEARPEEGNRCGTDEIGVHVQV